MLILVVSCGSPSSQFSLIVRLSMVTDDVHVIVFVARVLGAPPSGACGRYAPGNGPSYFLERLQLEFLTLGQLTNVLGTGWSHRGGLVCQEGCEISPLTARPSAGPKVEVPGGCSLFEMLPFGGRLLTGETTSSASVSQCGRPSTGSCTSF